ncbi:MAG: hypothetical protein ACTS4U_01640 [Candidatus Hodgkinia cicadicola]
MCRRWWLELPLKLTGRKFNNMAASVVRLAFCGLRQLTCLACWRLGIGFVGRNNGNCFKCDE